MLVKQIENEKRRKLILKISTNMRVQELVKKIIIFIETNYFKIKLEINLFW